MKNNKTKTIDMITIIDRINKAATFRELRESAKDRYKESWNPGLREEAFIDGARALLELLRK